MFVARAAKKPHTCPPPLPTALFFISSSTLIFAAMFLVIPSTGHSTLSAAITVSFGPVAGVGTNGRGVMVVATSPEKQNNRAFLA